MTTVPNKTAIDPTWTWGSSANLKFVNAFNAPQIYNASAQLAQVQLPEPAVCTLYLSASMRSTDPSATISTFTLNLSQGLGRVTVPRQITFGGQPSEGSPIEWTLPFIPLHALQVDVSGTANFDFELAAEIDVQIYFVIAPITRIPQQIQKLQFGMALPGEADALDDELRTDLEGETPTAAQIMGQEAQQRVHGVQGDDDDDDEPEAAPAWMLDLVDALTKRLKRPPNKRELHQAVARYRQRTLRRAR